MVFVVSLAFVLCVCVRVCFVVGKIVFFVRAGPRFYLVLEWCFVVSFAFVFFVVENAAFLLSGGHAVFDFVLEWCLLCPWRLCCCCWGAAFLFGWARGV